MHDPVELARHLSQQFQKALAIAVVPKDRLLCGKERMPIGK